jgi:hypothetical protein
MAIHLGLERISGLTGRRRLLLPPGGLTHEYYVTVCRYVH